MTVDTLEHGSQRAASDPARPLLVQLLCADDLRVKPWRRVLARDARVLIGRADAPSEPGTLRIAAADPYMSARHTLLDGSSGAWRLSDAGSTNGTWLDGRRLEPGETAPLPACALIETGHTFFWFRTAAPVVESAVADRAATLNPEWEATLRKLERLARGAHPVLVTGESGAGKELVARAIHEHSGRRGALITVNCAALPEHLLEDELFGHVRGAFSGALTARDGLFRAAHEGTLFLDEIGDMPSSLQARLLRVLEYQKVRPLGAEAEIAVDVRIVAATHRDLAALVLAGTFRHDLLARLGLVPLQVPPLRERREDLGLLIRAVLDPAPNGLANVRFEVEALRALLLHRWPLNVRELRTCVLAAADLAREDDGTAVIAPAHLPSVLQTTARLTPRASAEDEAQRERLVQLLAEHRGNVAAVARALGQKRTNVQRLMARLGIARSAQ